MRRGRELAHQPYRQGGGDKRAAAKPHDRHAGRHAGPVGEPADQRRHRRDVAEPKPDAAEDAISEINDPQTVQVNADGRYEEAARPAQGRCKHSATRTAFLDPAAEHRGGCAEEEDRDTEDPAELGQFPVIRRRLADPDQLGHRQVEDAERIGLADAEMHAQGRRGDQPPAVARRGYRPGAVQKRESHDSSIRLLMLQRRSVDFVTAGFLGAAYTQERRCCVGVFRACEITVACIAARK